MDSKKRERDKVRWCIVRKGISGMLIRGMMEQKGEEGNSTFLFRWKLVQLGLDDQYKKLNEIKRQAAAAAARGGSGGGSGGGDGGGGSSNQDFLSVAVHYPWARAISQNKVPYYIK